VGFVSDLPTELIAAFRATLEEVASADLLIHVRDMSHPDCEAQAADVEDVLTSLGIGESEGPARIEAWNKIDLLQDDERQALLAEAARRDDVVPISAVTGWGVDHLREHIGEMLQRGTHVHHLRLDPAEGSRLAWLHSRGEVLEQRMDGDSLEVAVRLSPDNWARFQAMESA
jgi:GTP-binding protein HflX